MAPDEQLAFSNKGLKAALLPAILLCIIPVAIYFWGQLSGALPNEAVWERRGGNHGPWWDQWQAFFILLPMMGTLALSGLTLLFGISMSLICKQQRLLILGKSIVLSILQLVVFFSLICTVFWTID